MRETLADLEREPAEKRLVAIDRRHDELYPNYSVLPSAEELADKSPICRVMRVGENCSMRRLFYDYEYQYGYAEEGMEDGERN